jgi:hypothetical protein
MGRNLSPEEVLYNTESLLCDNFWAFHPELFDVLTEHERDVLLAYYPQEFTHIPDVFAYRREIIRRDPKLAAEARALLARVLEPVGVAMPNA